MPGFLQSLRGRQFLFKTYFYVWSITIINSLKFYYFILFIQALELEPEAKNCLVARSKCYLKLGDPQKALQDAEAALAEDKELNRVKFSFSKN